jgi:ribonuclease T2
VSFKQSGQPPRAPLTTNPRPRPADRFHFTIHGLWPNYDDGTWPQFCDSDYKFDEDKLDDLMDQLDEEWPSVFDSDETFWDHEWSKHGTCALNIFPTEHSYFKHVLKLHWRYDLAVSAATARWRRTLAFGISLPSS